MKKRTTLVRLQGRWLLARWFPEIGEYCVLDNLGGRCYGRTVREAVAKCYRKPLSGGTRHEALALAGTIKELEGITAAKVPVARIKCLTHWMRKR